VHDYADAETVHECFKHLHAMDTSACRPVVCARFLDCLHLDIHTDLCDDAWK
jgi:hypothetical protein